MPEGAELRYLAELIREHVEGNTLTKIISLNKKTIKLEHPLKIYDVYTKGKLLWLDGKTTFVHMHMGTSGWLYVDEKPKYTKFIFEFKDKTKIYLDDARRFAKVHIYSKEKHNAIIKKLGVDILTKEYTLKYFSEKLKKGKRNICAFLMDQKINAGLGNYAKSDSLYISRIDPNRKTNTLTNKEIEKLYNAIRFIAFSQLIEQLKDEGLKIPNDIKKIKPSKLEIPYKYKVYGKHKNENIIVETIAGRSTFYDPDKQK